MSDEVVIRYKWTAEENRTGLKQFYRAKYPRVLRVLFWTFLLSVTVWETVTSLRSNDPNPKFPFFACGAVTFILLHFFNQWAARRQFAKRPDRDAEIEWRISDEGLKTRYSHGHAELVWTAFCKVVRCESGFLFFPTTRLFHWLPRSGFADAADFEKVSAIAERNVAVFKRIA